MDNQENSKIKGETNREERGISPTSEKNIKLQVLQISLTAILVFLAVFSPSVSFSKLSAGNLLLIFGVMIVFIILVLSFISESFKSSEEREKQVWYDRIDGLSLSRKIWGEIDSPESKKALLRELKRLYEKALLENRESLAEAYKSEINEIEKDLE